MSLAPPHLVGAALARRAQARRTRIARLCTAGLQAQSSPLQRPQPLGFPAALAAPRLQTGPSPTRPRRGLVTAAAAAAAARPRPAPFPAASRSNTQSLETTTTTTTTSIGPALRRRPAAARTRPPSLFPLPCRRLSSSASSRAAYDPLPGLRRTTRDPDRKPLAAAAQPHQAVPLAELKARRKRLMARLPTNSVAIVPAASARMMATDIPHRFYQDPDFAYLCGPGMHEPDAVLVLEGGGSRSDGDGASGSGEPEGVLRRSLLCVLPKDVYREMWDGIRFGPEAAGPLFGVDETIDTAQLVPELVTVLNRAKHVYFDTRSVPSVHDREVLKVLQASQLKVQPLRPHLHQLRLFKSDTELGLLRLAGEVSSQAVMDGMSMSRPGINERQLDAVIEYSARVRGGEGLAYPPVVAGGARANTLHYVENDQEVRDGELVLVDAGCTFHGYCGDISRTWPINGTFTDPQREVYEAVLRVQKQCIELCAADDMSLSRLHTNCSQLIASELIDLDIPMGIATGTQVRQMVRRFFPHMVGHYLGLDVHDTTSIPGNMPLQNGMVVTVEPGVYLPDVDDVPARYRNIGIRIEDDVAIVDGKAEVLTASCVKDVDDIERLMQGSHS